MVAFGCLSGGFGRFQSSIWELWSLSLASLSYKLVHFAFQHPNWNLLLISQAYIYICVMK
jgi:hypothetical protein